jgi:hypothetical protein
MDPFPADHPTERGADEAGGEAGPESGPHRPHALLVHQTGGGQAVLRVDHDPVVPELRHVRAVRVGGRRARHQSLRTGSAARRRPAADRQPATPRARSRTAVCRRTIAARDPRRGRGSQPPTDPGAQLCVARRPRRPSPTPPGSPTPIPVPTPTEPSGDDTRVCGRRHRPVTSPSPLRCRQPRAPGITFSTGGAATRAPLPVGSGGSGRRRPEFLGGLGFPDTRPRRHGRGDGREGLHRARTGIGSWCRRGWTRRHPVADRRPRRVRRHLGAPSVRTAHDIPELLEGSVHDRARHLSGEEREVRRATPGRHPPAGGPQSRRAPGGPGRRGAPWSSSLSSIPLGPVW